MWRAFKKLFKGKARFDPSAAKQLAMDVQIRPYERSDFNACKSIYLANYTGRLDDRYLDDFIEALNDESNVWFVATRHGDVLGVGGLRRRTAPQEMATLLFGMVDPEAQRQGIGTALLLSRIGSLPEPDGWVLVDMVSAGLSTGFYEHFGFRFLGSSMIDDERAPLDGYYTIVTRKAWAMCRLALDQCRQAAP